MPTFGRRTSTEWLPSTSRARCSPCRRRLADEARREDHQYLDGHTVLPTSGVGVYSATKAAVEQFTRVGALEFGAREITVNTVSPGATATELFHQSNPPGAAELAAGLTPLGRIGQPADVADVVAFLAGPDARWLTGQHLRASGGLDVGRSHPTGRPEANHAR